VLCCEAADAERSIAAKTSGPVLMNYFSQLSGGHAILDIVGSLVANVRQFQQFLLVERVVSFLGQSSILLGLVSKVASQSMRDLPKIPG
jgi:hypothetical protein